jgi:hypothetical protein
MHGRTWLMTRSSGATAGTAADGTRRRTGPMSISTEHASIVQPKRGSGRVPRTRIEAPRITSAVARCAGQSNSPRRAKLIPCQPVSQSVPNA